MLAVTRRMLIALLILLFTASFHLQAGSPANVAQQAKLDKYTVQGIKLGMKTSEASAVLKNAGFTGHKTHSLKPDPDSYLKKESNGISKKIILNSISVVNADTVYQIVYVQTFPGNVHFDINAAAKIIKQKYGKPDIDRLRGGGKIMIVYYADAHRSTSEGVTFSLRSKKHKKEIKERITSAKLMHAAQEKVKAHKK